jgi:hypothetical protein
MKMNLARLSLLLCLSLCIPACGGGGGRSKGPVSGSNVDYDNTTSGLAATNVQDAIDELDFRLDLLEQVPSDSVQEANASAAFLYNVPAGQSLIITYFKANGSSDYTVAGVRMGWNAGSKAQIVVNEGEAVSAGSPSGDTPIMSGYLVPKARAPGVGIHINGMYTVPVGKTLYITQIFTPVIAVQGNITIDGKLLVAQGVAPQGENVFIPVVAGKVVNAIGTSTVHGYLR